MFWGLSTEVWVVIGLGILLLMLLLNGAARLYRKAGPHEALIVYGFRNKRVVVGRGTIVLPMIENCHDLSLELMSFDVAPQQDLYTKQGVAVTVEAVAQIKVKSDRESVLTAAEQFLTKTAEQHAREQLGLTHPEQGSVAMANDDRIHALTIETDPVARVVVRADGTVALVSARARCSASALRMSASACRISSCPTDRWSYGRSSRRR